MPKNIWDQFAIAKQGADAWAGWGLGVLNAPVAAARNITENYRPGPENEPLNEDIGRQGMTAAAALSPGIARASGGELGVAAGRIMQRSDTRKMIRDMWTEGKTERQIAAAINERFAPLLDEGAEVTKGMVSGVRSRAEKAGDFELGAMGSKRAAPREQFITPEHVEETMRSLGYENIRRVPPKTGNSEYIYGDPPGNPPRSYGDTPVVRVSDDGHLGRPLSGREVGNRYDTGTPDPTRRRVDERAYLNQGGTPYADPTALENVLRWRRGDLVSPDDAPRGLYHLPPLEKKPLPPREGPDYHPDQLKLLSGGVPAPIMDPWQTETVREDAGRFSRPLVSPDDRLVRDTQDLTERVRSAQAEGAGRHARPAMADARPLDVDVISEREGVMPSRGDRAKSATEFLRNFPDSLNDLATVRAAKSIWDQFERVK